MTTATERAARRWQASVATRVGLLAAGVLFAVLLVAPMPRGWLEAFGAPRAGMAWFGGLRAGWLRQEPDVDTANLQGRLERRGLTATLQSEGPFVTIEIPGVREDDMARVLRIVQGPGTVEVRKIEADGTLDSRVLFDRAQIKEAAVTSHFGKGPTVGFMLWMPDGARRPRIGPFRVAIIVDHDVRGTAVLWSPFADVMVLHVEGGDLTELAEALDGSALHGGAILYTAYVPAIDLARFVWVARATIAGAGGVVAALIAFLFLRAFRCPRRLLVHGGANRGGASSMVAGTGAPAK